MIESDYHNCKTIDDYKDLVLDLMKKHNKYFRTEKLKLILDD